MHGVDLEAGSLGRRREELGRRGRDSAAGLGSSSGAVVGEALWVGEEATAAAGSDIIGPAAVGLTGDAREAGCGLSIYFS